MKKKWVKIILDEIHSYQKVLNWYEKFGHNFYYYYLKIRDFMTGKQTLLHFVYKTNTTCTLKCKECHSYMPYFTNKTHYTTDFETFKKEIDKLLKSVDLIVSFRFQGGETLLTKDLAKMVEYASSKKQIQHIQIITNGTIIPSDDLIKAMKHPKVLLNLSDYSHIDEIKDRLKYKEIIKLCTENKINAQHWLSKAGSEWVKRNTISEKETRNKELSIKNLAACFCFGTPKCIIMFRGKLYICAPAIYFSAINPDFKIDEDENIDILNTKQSLLKRKIKHFISKRYFNLCARCDAKENINTKIKPGVQL